MASHEDWGVRPEAAEDRAAIFEVQCAAFGRDDEARLVDALRTKKATLVSLVAEREDRVVAHVLFTRLPLETPQGIIDAVALAPIAVLPAWQRQGCGSALIRAGLAACRSAGERIVLVLGEPEYYRRFGFRSELASRIGPFTGEAYMGLELEPKALAGVSGTARYAEPFEQL